MSKHLLQENYERFFGSLKEGTSSLPQDLQLKLIEALKQAGFQPTAIRNTVGTVLKDPGSLATTIELSGMDSWGMNSKAKAKAAIQSVDPSIQVNNMVNAVPKMGRKAFIVILSSKDI